MAFDITKFVENYTKKILEGQGGGGLPDVDALKLLARNAAEVSRRRYVTQVNESMGQSGIQSVNQLFAGGVAEQQAKAQETQQLLEINRQDATLRRQSEAAARNAALQAAPMAQYEANKPSFLSKVGGALVGGAFSAFLPQLALKLFPVKPPGDGGMPGYPQPDATPQNNPALMQWGNLNNNAFYGPPRFDNLYGGYGYGR